MTTKGFSVRHTRDAQFVSGLRSFFEYRDLGVREATADFSTVEVPAVQRYRFSEAR
ncbi:MAG TPA: hypothetical protein VFN64_10795 [Burkholderiaceae bacterium]|nr:hypothetical protein [Burkholderiaceae bacterium]